METATSAPTRLAFNTTAINSLQSRQVVSITSEGNVDIIGGVKVGMPSANSISNGPLFYIYDDGSVEKKIILH